MEQGGGGSNIVFTYRDCLRSWNAPFPIDIPIMCLKVCDDVDAVIRVKNA